MRANAGADAREPLRAARALEVRVIDDDESKRVPASVLRRAQPAWPEAMGKQNTRAQTKPLTTVHEEYWSAVHDHGKRLLTLRNSA